MKFGTAAKNICKHNELRTVQDFFSLNERIFTTCRYIAIREPLKYHTIMGRQRMVYMVALCWGTVLAATLTKDIVVWQFSNGPQSVLLVLLFELKLGLSFD